MENNTDIKLVKSSHMALTGGPPSQNSTTPRPIKLPCMNNQDNYQIVQLTSQALEPDHDKLSSSIRSKRLILMKLHALKKETRCSFL